MRCAFCLVDGDLVKISKEHLFSVPICTALGLDRQMLIASFDANTGDVGPIVPLDQRQVRLPCTNCNSGWMSQLENDTAHTLRR